MKKFIWFLPVVMLASSGAVFGFTPTTTVSRLHETEQPTVTEIQPTVASQSNQASKNLGRPEVSAQSTNQAAASTDSRPQTAPARCGDNSCGRSPVCTDTIGGDCAYPPPPGSCSYDGPCAANNDDIVPTRCAKDLPCGDTPGPTQDNNPPTCTKYDVCGAQPANDSL